MPIVTAKRISHIALKTRNKENMHDVEYFGT